MRAVLLALLLLAGSALGQSPLDRAAGTAAGAITPRVNAAVDKVAPVPRALPPAKNPQCRMLAWVVPALQRLVWVNLRQCGIVHQLGQLTLHPWILGGA